MPLEDRKLWNLAHITQSLQHYHGTGWVMYAKTMVAPNTIMQKATVCSPSHDIRTRKCHFDTFANDNICFKKGQTGIHIDGNWGTNSRFGSFTQLTMSSGRICTILMNWEGSGGDKDENHDGSTVTETVSASCFKWNLRPFQTPSLWIFSTLWAIQVNKITICAAWTLVL